MPVIAIPATEAGQYPQLIHQMHQLRYRVFKERLDWEVMVSGDLEIDHYDALNPIYFLSLNENRVAGCARLLPSTGPMMLTHTFPTLLGTASAPSDQSVWESSRFAIDMTLASQNNHLGIHTVTCELIAAGLIWGLDHGWTEVVTVTDIILEKILRRAGCVLKRFSPPQKIGKLFAVAGAVEVSTQTLEKILTAGQITGPVLLNREFSERHAA